MDISLNICTKPIQKKPKGPTPQIENKPSEKQHNISNTSNFQFKKKNKKFGNAKFQNNTNSAEDIDDNLNNSAGFAFVKPKKQIQSSTNDGPPKNFEKKGSDHEIGQRFIPKTKTFALFGRERKEKTFPKEMDIEVKKSENVFGSKSITFTDLKIHDHIVKNLEKKGITKATSIQQIAIPKIFNGENLMIRSETGSGKTLAYSIPIINALRSITPKLTRKDGIQALIIVPTRELALQTLEVFKELVYSSCWIVPGIVCGGENRKAEKERLRKGINVLIGTPGRLLDHLLHSTNLKLESVRCLVIDEADSLVEMGHKDDVKRIVTMVEDSRKNSSYDPMALLKGKSQKIDENKAKSFEKMPLEDPKSKNIQTIFLSATLSKKVEELKDLVLKNYDSVESDEPTFEKTETSNITAPNIEQKFIVTETRTRLVVLASLIVKRFQEEDCKMFIFMDTRQMVEFHEELFLRYLLDPVAKKFDFDEMEDSDDEEENKETESQTSRIEIFKIHGDMEQKERTKTYKSFRNSKKGILLCTDAAARGIDIPAASYVIQYTAPLNTDLYLHRIGRTARAGLKGESIIFLTEPEVEYVNYIRQEHNVKITPLKEEKILENLIEYMSHLGKMNAQSSAEKLQKRFEEAVEGNKKLFKMACLAYMSWYRYYRMFPKSHREFFNAKEIHSGHYIKSFALKISLGEIIKASKKDSENSEKPEKRLNLKLALNPEEERRQRELNNKRKSNTEVSEFDSGLKGIKKKKFKK